MSENQDVVADVIDGRVDVYGDPVEGMERTAQIWSGITGHHIKATDVPLMLMGYKLMRAARTPDYADNSDDVEGYLDIFRKVVGPDMVHARTVGEYLDELRRREKIATTATSPIPAPVHGPLEEELTHHGVTLYRILPSMVDVADYVTFDKDSGGHGTPLPIAAVTELDFRIGGETHGRAKSGSRYKFWRADQVPTSVMTTAQSLANARGDQR